MATERWIATFKFSKPLDGKAADGGVSDTSHAIVFCNTRDKMPERRKFALAWASKLGMAEGAISVDVQPETGAHNIPALDPAGWKRLEEKCHEINRRIKGSNY